MSLIQTLYVLAAIVSLSAGIPQLTRIMKTKNSQGFSLRTWVMWVGTQSISTMYVISIGDRFMMVTGCAWVAFYAAMTVLIIRYSKQPRLRRLWNFGRIPAPAPAPVEDPEGA